MVILPASVRLMAVVGIGLVAGCYALGPIPTSVTVPTSHYRAASAGLVGCPTEEIVISGEQNVVKLGDGPVTWRASCRGHQFICSHAGARGSSPQCSEELKPAAAATPTAAGQP